MHVGVYFHLLIQPNAQTSYDQVCFHDNQFCIPQSYWSNRWAEVIIKPCIETGWNLLLQNILFLHRRIYERKYIFLFAFGFCAILRHRFRSCTLIIYFCTLIVFKSSKHLVFSLAAIRWVSILFSLSLYHFSLPILSIYIFLYIFIFFIFHIWSRQTMILCAFIALTISSLLISSFNLWYILVLYTPLIRLLVWKIIMQYFLAEWHLNNVRDNIAK